MQALRRTKPRNGLPNIIQIQEQARKQVRLSRSTAARSNQPLDAHAELPPQRRSVAMTEHAVVIAEEVRQG